MITEEEISHQNNNIFDLSHPRQQDESIIVGCVATMSCDAGSRGVEEEWRAGAENMHET